MVTALDPPTLEELMKQYQHCDLSQHSMQIFLRDLHSHVSAEWWRDSKRLYQLVYDSVDLSGPFHLSDLAMIKRTCWMGDSRLGGLFYKWVRSHGETSSASSQFKINSKLNELSVKKLPTTISTLDLHRHCNELLDLWQLLSTNSISQPADFYVRLLFTLPTQPDEAKLVKLRSWLAERVEDKADILSDPLAVIETLISRGTALGMPTGEANQVTAINGTKETKEKMPRSRNCAFSGSTLCKCAKTGNSQKSNCKVFNLKLKIDGTVGQNSFVQAARKYWQKHKLDTLRGVKPEQILADAKGTVAS